MSPALAIWFVESIPIKIRTVLVTVTLFTLSLAVIHNFVKKSGLSYGEIGWKWPERRDLTKTSLFWILGTSSCILWASLYFSAFEMLFPVQYGKLAALKTTGYIQYLFEWGRAGGFYGALVLWGSILLLATIEELTFIGIVFTSLKKEFSFTAALLWSTALFTLAHLNPYSFPVTFGLGLIFSLLYVKSGGLAVPISVHFAYNLALVYLGKYIY